MNDFGKKFSERLYQFSLSIAKEIRTLPQERITIRLSDQLFRSSSSIVANYTEGQVSISRKELIRYLHISLKSAHETELWLKMMKDLQIMIKPEFEKEVDEIIRILTKSIKSLKSTQEPQS